MSETTGHGSSGISKQEVQSVFQEMEQRNEQPSSSSSASTGRYNPRVAMLIRKTSIVSFLVVVLSGLLWWIRRTMHSIQQWQPPSGEDMDSLCWPVVEAYLFLVAQLGLFVTVTLFASMIPSLVMTWIVAVVIEYLFGIRVGRKGHTRLIEKGGDWAREMSWSTFQSAVREGKVFVTAAVLTLMLLPWVLGKSNIFAGRDCH